MQEKSYGKKIIAIVNGDGKKLRKIFSINFTIDIILEWGVIFFCQFLVFSVSDFSIFQASIL